MGWYLPFPGNEPDSTRQQFLLAEPPNRLHSETEFFQNTNNFRRLEKLNPVRFLVAAI